MEITRNTRETGAGPADWFTGSVYLDTIATPDETSRLGAAAVHFTPGARTAWHTHPLGQTIWVTARRRHARGDAGRPRRRPDPEPARGLGRARHRLVRGGRRRSRPGRTVAVVGDGAVGLLAVLAAKQLGAERIVAIARRRCGASSRS